MRIDVAAFGLLIGTSGCLGSRSAATALGGPDGGGSMRPLTQTISVQAAFNDSLFFLRVRWASASVAPALSVALSGGGPATAVRDFATAGCFLGCHDASNGMPNWRPDDGERGMYLLPGFGGPADVWLWNGQAPATARAAVTTLGSDGMNDDPDAGAGGLAATALGAGEMWDVVLSRALAPEPPGHVALAAGSRVTLGFALHPDGVEGRNHYVSLPVPLGLGEVASEIVATPLPPGATPDFADATGVAAYPVDLFLPGLTSFEFLVGAVVDRNGQLRSGDVRHGGAQAVAAGTHTCGDCHRVEGDAVVPPVQNAGALERLVLRRGGVVSPPQIGGSP